MRSFLIGVAAAAIVSATGISTTDAQMFSRGNGLINEAAHALDRGKWDKGVSRARQALKSGELTPRNVPALSDVSAFGTN